MSPEVYRLSPWEECVGPLNGLEVKERALFAQIGKISLILPLEMEDKMRDHLGGRVGILRTDEPKRPYLFRVYSCN